MRLLRRILVQPRATLEQLRAAIDKWEADLAEYVQRGNRDLDDPPKVTILLSMVPEQLEDHLEMNIGRLDTYAKARAEVISYTEQKAAKIDDGGAAPMDLDAFKGNKGGKGKGGKGKEKNHNPDKDVVCHLCKKKGHRKSACWYAKENGGTGKPPEPKEPRAGAKGTKGKKGGKGKGGKGTFGPVSWTWSQPWKVALAECQVGTKDGPTTGAPVLAARDRKRGSTNTPLHSTCGPSETSQATRVLPSLRPGTRKASRATM